MRIKTVSADDQSFNKFGMLTKVSQSQGISNPNGWFGWFIPELCAVSAANFGLAIAKNSDSEVSAMSRCTEAPIMLMCGSGPLTLVVAPSAHDLSVAVNDVKAFVLYPGEYVTLNSGVWYTACGYKAKQQTYYYFLVDDKKTLENVKIDTIQIEVE